MTALRRAGRWLAEGLPARRGLFFWVLWVTAIFPTVTCVLSLILGQWGDAYLAAGRAVVPLLALGFRWRWLDERSRHGETRDAWRAESWRRSQ